MGFAHAFGPGMGGVICNTDQKSSTIKEEIQFFLKMLWINLIPLIDINFTCRIKHIHGNEIVMEFLQY